MKVHAQEPMHPSLSTYPTGLTTTGQSRVLELRLMHHYTTFTCSQLPDGELEQGRYIWSKDVPRLAFQSELVLNALLGISALHLKALAPDDQTLSQAAASYFNKAIQTHRIALSTVDKESSEAVLATAIIICHHTWIAGHSSLPDEPYEIPLQTYHMARDIRALFDQMCPWLSGSPYLWYIQKQPASEIFAPCPSDHWIRRVEEDLLRIAKTFNSDEVSAENKTVYEKAAEEILSMCHAITCGAGQQDIQKRVATMPLSLPLRFLQLVELKYPRALCLLARNLALLKIIDSVWWLHGIGSQTVAEKSVTGIRDMLPEEWLWAMNWPMGVISGDIRP